MPVREPPRALFEIVAELAERIRRLERIENIRVARVSTGSVPASSSVTVTAPWTNRFTNTDYAVAVTVEGGDAPGIVVLRVLARTEASVQVRIQNDDPVAAHSAILHVIAVHD